MSGKFQERHKIIYRSRAKSLELRKPAVKLERSSTPQRWSRRIRSLPPIPFDMLPTNQRKKPIEKKPSSKKCVAVKRECKSSYQLVRNAGTSGNVMSLPKFIGGEVNKSKRHIVVKKRYVPDVEETVRIVPFIVFKKNKKVAFRTCLDNYEIEIKNKPKELLSKKNAPVSDIEQQIRRDCMLLGKKWSRMIKVLPPNSLVPQ